MNQSQKTYMASGAIVAFIAVWSFIWILLITFPASFTRYRECGEKPACDAPADPKRCLGWSFLFTLIIVILVWLLRGMAV